MAADTQERHRPGALKQQNKSHKAGKHKTKGQLEREVKGRVNVKVLSKKAKFVKKKNERRHQAEQARKHKREEVLAKKRSRGGAGTPPHCVVVVPLHASLDAKSAVKLILDSDDTALAVENQQGIQHMSIPRFKQRVEYLSIDYGNLYDLLDAVKVADSLLLLLSTDNGVDEFGDYCLSCLLGQGLPAVTLALQGLKDIPVKKQTDVKKQIQKYIDRWFPGEKLHCLDSSKDGLLVLRHITSQKLKPIYYRENRPHLLAENIKFELENDSEAYGTLQLTGYLRGQTLSVNRLVHLPGWGDFQLSQADVLDDPFPLQQRADKQSRKGQIQILCNSLWYITNHHQTINDAAQHRPGVVPVPPCFEEFTGYDERKRKKQKQLQMTSIELNSHGQALYSLLLKPIIKTSPEWAAAYNDIKALADCLLSYRTYLEKQATIQEHNRSLDHPVRTVDQFTTVEPRQSSVGVKESYRLLDQELRKAGVGEPVFVDESLHLPTQFESPVQRHRFYKDLQLSVPVDIYRFCPGGSIVTTTCLVQARPDRTEPQILIECTRIAMAIRPKLQEVHTRAQKRVFKEKLSNISKVVPAVADLIYKELSLDAAAAAHPDTQERLRLIFLGEKGLLTDLRKLNPGRPSGCFDDFFEKLSEVVEEVTVADERRHGTEHLSQWISLNDLIDKALEKCPEGTAIPSKSLVRLQFAPRNPYASTALQFTSKIPVQYKIQRRQLRVSHADDHYCAAQFKYMREMAIEMKDKCTLIFSDDKAKVPVGEPDAPISTGVRGKKTLTPVASTLVAADHDMSKSSLTPTVILDCNIPDDIDHSFVQGQVTTIINDSVFQQSSPFRHGVALSKYITELQKKKDLGLLLKFTDGGVDQRNTLESVKCATICLFRECNLDMVIMARCAPGHSYLNPAERVMSILNLGLQNCALERSKSDDDAEVLFKRCGSMADLRAKAVTNTDLKEKWKESLEPVQSCVRNRFLRLKLKDVPFQVMDPVTDGEIDIFQRHLRELFPDLDLSKLQKAHTSKNPQYTEWIEKHCRSRQYSFQIRKCDDPACCLAPSIPRDQLLWLPDPVLQENGDHFKAYKEVKGVETTEQDRPSLKKTKPAPVTVAPVTVAVTNQDQIEQETEAVADKTPQPAEAVADKTLQPAPKSGTNQSLFTAQNARSVVDCVECNKPRVVYSRMRLSERQKIAFLLSVSEYPYSCGGPIFPPDHPQKDKIMTRPNLCCAMPVEVPYYGGNVGRPDVCAYCGVIGAEKNLALPLQYKTVLPCCEQCLKDGKNPIVYRPYGKKK